ncbi:MAG TPA: response regulator, partial [Bacteroidota bacterium]|nr:response regulator [Bacteroidota bacterium]
MAVRAKKTILIVEDDKIEAMTEAAIISQFGYNVITAGSGEEAIPLVLGRPDIDMILMDIELGGGIDGGQCARRILEKRPLPIVFLTSHAEQEAVEKVRGVTRYGYTFKHSGEAVLQSSIEMAFDLFEARENLANEIEERKIVERTMKDESRRRQVLFDEAPDGILIIDPATARFLEF